MCIAVAILAWRGLGVQVCSILVRLSAAIFCTTMNEAPEKSKPWILPAPEKLFPR